ncbi:MAG: DUF460 domain-containing protein [Candidatus Micrarchaeaceae archaeon]
MQHIIVGLDPGKTTAIVCLNLEGNIVYKVSKKFAGFKWIVNEISKVGIPSIIATDKKNPNETIKKVNATFNAKLFIPQEDMKEKRKNLLASDKQLEDQHEKDAYAAAYKAYASYINKLNQAKRKAYEVNNIKNFDEICAKVIQKNSIKEALLGKVSNRK